MIRAHTSNASQPTVVIKCPLFTRLTSLPNFTRTTQNPRRHYIIIWVRHCHLSRGTRNVKTENIKPQNKKKMEGGRTFCWSLSICNTDKLKTNQNIKMKI